MKPPPVQYADSSEGKVAYQVVGDGPIDLLWVPLGLGSLDSLWEYLPLERFIRRLAAFSRLILLNPRGMGLSDPFPIDTPLPLEEWITDYAAVLDAVRSEQNAELGYGLQGVGDMLRAATAPERVRALILVDSHARLLNADDYPWGFHAEILDGAFDVTIAQWGTGENLRLVSPDLADDERFREWYARTERGSMSPTALAVALRGVIRNLDVRSILPAIKAPTLVISHAEVPALPEARGHSRYLAEHIPNTRLVERPGMFAIPFLHDVEGTLAEIETFLTGTKGTLDLDDRVLATVLFTDIVGSTARAARVGDKRWGMVRKSMTRSPEKRSSASVAAM